MYVRIMHSVYVLNKCFCATNELDFITAFGWNLAHEMTSRCLLFLEQVANEFA